MIKILCIPPVKYLFFLKIITEVKHMLSSIVSKGVSMYCYRQFTPMK